MARYINQLQDELETANHDKALALEALSDLRAYLTGCKFTSLNAGDRRFLVNTQDVLDRIAPAISACLPT